MQQFLFQCTQETRMYEAICLFSTFLNLVTSLVDSYDIYAHLIPHILNRELVTLQDMMMNTKF
jgi:hypothetical protein